MEKAVMDISTIEQEIVEEFALFDDPMMQYEYIIDLGKKLPPMPEAHQTEENIVKGCQSTVYLHSNYDGERMHYEADSNTVITKGIIALLVRVLDQQTPEAVVKAPLSFIDQINLRSHLSEQRSNGLSAMMQRMKTDAQQHLSK